MNPGLLMLIINIIILVFMGIGFLRGLVGLKFTLVRFAFFLLAIALSLLTMNLVADILATTKILGEKSIYEIFIDLVQSSEFLSGMYQNNTRVQQVINQLPHVLCQSLSFTIAMIIFTILCSISYTFVKIFVLKHIKWFDYGHKKKREKGEKVKGVSIRSRIFGGLMGMIFGFVVLVMIMLPISGLVGTVGDIIGTSSTTFAEEEKTTDLILGDSFEVVNGYINAYQNTPLGAFSGIGNFDREFVRKVTKVEIDGKNVNLIDSVENMSVIYGDIQYLVEFFSKYESIEDINNLNVTRLKNVVNYAFENELFDSLFDEVVSYTLDYIITTNDKMEADLKQFIVKINDEMELNGSPKNYIKTEVLNILDIVQILVDSKIATNVEKLVANKDNKLDNINLMIGNLLKEGENQTTYINNAISKLNNSKTLNISSCFVFNKVLDNLEDKIMAKLNNNNLQKGFLGRVSLDENIEFDKIGSIVEDIGELCQSISKSELKGENVLYKFLTTKTNENTPLLTYTTTQIGSIADSILQLDILNTKVDSTNTILDNICYYFKEAEILSVINWESLQIENVISSEIEKINISLELFFNSTSFETIKANTYEKSQLKEDIIEFLASKTNGVSNVKTIVLNILSTKIFQNFEKDILNKLMVNINATINTFVKDENQDLPQLTLTNLHSDIEREKIANYAQIIIEYYNSIYNKEQEMIYNIIESDFASLGSVLEGMRGLEMFNNGYYSTLMLKLDKMFKEYLDFEVATKSEFSWIETMEDYGQHLKGFLNHNLIYNDEEIKMFDVVYGTTEMTFVEAVESMGIETIVDYYDNLKDCELINPITQILYNKIQELIPSI